MTPHEHYLAGETILAGCEKEAKAIEKRSANGGMKLETYRAACDFNTMAATIAQAHFLAANAIDTYRAYK